MSRRKYNNIHAVIFIYKTAYNYLGLKAKTTDAVGNVTKLSYDKFGQISQTENPDASSSLTENIYISNFNTTFYTITGGFVNMQVYTDETGRKFEKYFDAVGNLLREIKYVWYDPIAPDKPIDSDSSGLDFIGFDDRKLITDYKYDDLYRIIEVKTPAGKHIYYSYDALGRQSSRTTPDAGQTKYIYDKNDNLLFSQDANQRASGTNIYTFRNYDGLNRLLSMGETQIGGISPDFDDIESGNETDYSGTPEQMLTINAYDSLVYASVNIFNNVPSDYYISGKSNNTKGNIVATAYRTKNTDQWSYKFYRYDARGRVIKQWNFITGLGWKAMTYSYNSQNQVTYLNYQPAQTDGKLFKYSYDDAARLEDVSIYGGIPSGNEETDNLDNLPGDYFSFASYQYNKNSQISNYKFNDNTNNYKYAYNNRNWIYTFTKATGNSDFTYVLNYLPNGNVRKSTIGGNYKNYFSDNNNLSYTYIYDKSNRLLKADRDSGNSNTAHDLTKSYDDDGNFYTLKRNGQSGNAIDNFNYSYYLGTNRLYNVTGARQQYSYDYNGNLTQDNRDANILKQNIKYDNRNLMTEMRVSKLIEEGVSNIYEIHQLKFEYDDAGNRVRKRDYLYTGAEPEPVFEDTKSSNILDLYFQPLRHPCPKFRFRKSRIPKFRFGNQG